jgi:hypothetical protein
VVAGACIGDVVAFGAEFFPAVRVRLRGGVIGVGVLGSGEVDEVDGGEVESFGPVDGADLDAVVGFPGPVSEVAVGDVEFGEPPGEVGELPAFVAEDGGVAGVDACPGVGADGLAEQQRERLPGGRGRRVDRGAVAEDLDGLVAGFGGGVEVVEVVVGDEGSCGVDDCDSWYAAQLRGR